MSFSVKQAQPTQGVLVSEILLEAISWMDAHQVIRAEVAPRFIYGDKAQANLFAVKLFLV